MYSIVDEQYIYFWCHLCNSSENVRLSDELPGKSQIVPHSTPSHVAQSPIVGDVNGPAKIVESVGSLQESSSSEKSSGNAPREMEAVTCGEAASTKLEMVVTPFPSDSLSKYIEKGCFQRYQELELS